VEEPETTGDPEVIKKLGVGRHRAARRWFSRLIVLLVLGLIGGGVWFWRARVNRTPTERWVMATAEIGDLRETVTATGTLSPLDAVEVGAEVTGRVVTVHVDINDPVKVGQVLVEIDPELLVARVEESAAQLRGAQASYTNAKATVKETELKAQRLRELHKRGLVSDQELETAEAELERAKASMTSSSAQVTVAQAGLKSANSSRGKAKINSPIDGIVLARSVEPGQTVTSGLQTPILFTLARDLTQMQLKVDVDEADVGKVQEGLRARFVVDAYPGRNFSSKVLRLNNLPKAATTVITYEALLTVDNSERLLRPGMTATATIVTSEKKNVLTVPNAALRFRPSEPAGSATARPGVGLPVPGLGGGAGPWGRGGGQRGGGQRGGAGARPAGSSDATRGARSETAKGTVYVVRGEAGLTRIDVTLGASDGRRTELLGGEITPGTEVVIDVEEAPK
jgi:HlyD family secretion protein